MKKNIGVITFHCSYNYGSMLQAYALQQYLKKQGYNTKIIDYILSSDFEQYKLFRNNLYRERKKSLIADIVYFHKNLKRKYNFNKFSNRCLFKSEKTYYDFEPMKELNSEFDTFICGSDQIWNFDCTKGIIPAYFLEFADDDKLKISYAPSIAQTSFEKINETELYKLLNRLDYISVREESTIPILRGIIDKDMSCVLDPTLLLDSGDYNNIVEEYKIKGKFIFVYILEESSKILDYCRSLSKDENIKIVYIRKKNIYGLKNSKNVYGISPGQFLYLIKNAEYIVTNSFHATVFSILFEKRFVTFKTKKSYSRMTDLLNNIGLQDRIYCEGFKIKKTLNYVEVKHKLIKLRKISQEYLRKALSKE